MRKTEEEAIVVCLTQSYYSLLGGETHESFDLDGSAHSRRNMKQQIYRDSLDVKFQPYTL
jgi:hypothetical protein